MLKRFHVICMYSLSSIYKVVYQCNLFIWLDFNYLFLVAWLISYTWKNLLIVRILIDKSLWNLSTWWKWAIVIYSADLININEKTIMLFVRMKILFSRSIISQCSKTINKLFALIQDNEIFLVNSLFLKVLSLILLINIWNNLSFLLLKLKERKLYYLNNLNHEILSFNNI